MKKIIGLFLLLSFCCGRAFAQANRLDSLLQLLPAAKADTNAVRLYIDLGRHYQNAGDLKSSSAYYLKAQALSRELNDSHGLFYSSDYYSHVLNLQGFYDSAIVVSKEMLTLASKQQNLYQEAIEKWNIGTGYANKGFNEKALDYFMEVLAYFEQANYQEDQRGLLFTIQNIYARMDRYKDAIPYGEKALALMNDTLGVVYGNALLNMSVCYYSLSPPQNEKALACLQKVLSIASHTRNALLEARAYNCIANIHFRNNRMYESEEYYQKAIAFFREDTYPNYFCIANIGLAKIAMFRNDFAKAEAMVYKNLEITRRLGIRLEEKNALSFLWELSAAKHDWEGRLRYKAAFDSVQNLVVNETMLRAAEEIETKYETEKKEIRIASLEDEKRLMLWLSVATVAILLLGLAALFFLWRWTIQKKRLAEQQIKQFEKEKQLVATQAVLDGEIQERTRLARDLHDGLGSMLTGIKLNLESVKNGIAPGFTRVEYFDSALKMLDDSMGELRRVAHHLMPETLSREGLKTALGDFCRSLSTVVVFDWYGGEERLTPQLEVVIYRIIHELVNNALKYAAASQIMVQVMQDADRVAFIVQDDGVGFDISAATQGMGLSNIRTRVASFGGSMEIHSKAGEGTEISVEMKVEKADGDLKK